MELSSIISGLLGGLLSVIVCTYLSKSVKSSKAPGNLYFGKFMIVLACFCMVLSISAFTMYFVDDDAWEKRSELLSITLLFVGFGSGAIYALLEYFIVTGSFDENGILFRTPWTGVKKENWQDLVSVKFNAVANWYVLTFKSGAKIRISNLLTGHGEVLELIRRL